MILGVTPSGARLSVINARLAAGQRRGKHLISGHSEADSSKLQNMLEQCRFSNRIIIFSNFRELRLATLLALFPP